MPDYTQRNARTRPLYYARVSGRKVPFDRKGNGQTYLTVNAAVPDP